MSEPTVCRIISKIEDILKRCPDFRLPGKKVLQENENLFEKAQRSRFNERAKRRKSRVGEGKNRVENVIRHLKILPIVA